MTPRPEAALAHLIEQDFDLIVAKLRMEDFQSLDVLKRARKLNPEVRIMVVSADCNVIFPLEAFQIEVDDYLLLPINPNKLISRVDQCLEKLAAVKAAKGPKGKRCQNKIKSYSAGL
jgi:two-component system response regulator YesN